MNTPTTCPCGSEKSFDACCGPYLAGQSAAPTAEALMRSRFTAFELRNADYLKESWDPGKRPASLDFEGDTRTWSRLEIVGTVGGGESDDRGVVEFKAQFELGDDTYLIHEVSRFHRVAGRWVYLDGTIHYHGKIAHKGEILRNAPCPCGSGKKYKKCCGGSSSRLGKA
ncbi:YchJ family protein [Methylocaldum sp.]|uniref:YchJ family protein n=1 Tax=Methylocaldum sp. TaxID=1969727 RepID=UPI002D29403A|nr:YchJ family protein [Methylocaldum sp.]HYE37222.1 YchJ family protein [Methylocaldum sp.]